jgi:uncharacterized protein YdhG (YjbR/CyaY superfamily)
MAKTDFKSVDEYIATFPEGVQAVLRTIRRTIQEAVPDAEEVISYQIPAYKFHGWVFYFSAHKKHYSLSCPPPFAVFTAFAQELSPYVMSKSAIQFPLDQPVPVKLIADMARYQASENLKRETLKAKA